MGDLDDDGWLCCFCGELAELGEAFLAVRVASRGAEQFFAAHRACFVERLADDEAIRGGPLFDE